MSELKERHGCVNFWLWLVIVANLCIAITNIATMFSSIFFGFGLAAILAVLNILGTILLMRWNKCGFYLYAVSAVLSAVVSIAVLDEKPYVIASSLFAIIIWWGILHIKKNGIPAWRLMEGGWDYKHCRHLYQVFGVVMGVLLIMAIIVCNGNDNDDLKVLSDNELTVDSVAIDDTVAADSVAVDEEDLSESIEWREFSDNRNSCSIEVPGSFRKASLSEDQVLGLICSDNDPAVIVIRESASDVTAAEISTSKEYANALVKMNRNAEGVSDFKRIGEEPYGRNSYLVTYEIFSDGYAFHHKILVTRTKSNFYYCQVYCLKQYADKLQPVMSRILSSFKAKE